MESLDQKYQALAQLRWQVELGATDAISDEPQSWYEQAKQAAPKPVKSIAPQSQSQRAPVPMQAQPRPEEISLQLARQSQDLDALQKAMNGYRLCELRQGAKNLVFCDGNPKARVMIIGEMPGREEDIQGKPFVGPAGQFLDKFFAAIGLSRDAQTAQEALYLTNVMPWRPPGNREPEDNEIAMMLPFLHRHIELVSPKIIVLMGNIACHALLRERGITKIRGQWRDYHGIAMMPMLHPAYVLRRSDTKAQVWQDLKAIRLKLRQEIA